jgi:hypothetical protein
MTPGTAATVNFHDERDNLCPSHTEAGVDRADHIAAELERH